MRPSTLPVQSCIFCGSPGLSAEDLWPLWLSKTYPPPAVDGWWLATAATNKGPRHPHRTRRLAKRLHLVCTTCNNGWMSRLEERAKPLLLPLLQASFTPYSFSAETTGVLVAWIVKMAMVWEYAVRTVPKFFGPDRCGQFRTRQSPPPDVSLGVWLGRRHRGASDVMTHASIRNHLAFSSPVPQAPEFYRVAKYVQTSTFAIDQLVIQVMAQRGLAAAATDFAAYDIDDLLFRLWPRPKTLNQWPTRQYMVDPHLRALAQRLDGQPTL